MPATALVRPRTRGDCFEVPRPCPWASCRHSLIPELIRSGRIGDDDELPEGVPTCSLDQADRGDSTLEEIGALLGVTREAVRITAKKALERFTLRAVAAGFIDRPGWGATAGTVVRADGTIDATGRGGKTTADSATVSDADPDGDELASEDRETKWPNCPLEGLDQRDVSASFLDFDDEALCRFVDRIYARAIAAAPTESPAPLAPTEET